MKNDVILMEKSHVIVGYHKPESVASVVSPTSVQSRVIFEMLVSPFFERRLEVDTKMIFACTAATPTVNDKSFCDK